MLKSWINSGSLQRVKKYSLGLLSIVLLSTFLTVSGFAQNRTTVTGTVTDADDGSPLPAVNVIVKGTTIGTATTTDGTFSIRVPSVNDTLIFSFLGYITQEIPLNGRTTVNVQLGTDVQLLDGIVVVGYGTQEEKEITSAVATVDAEEFNQGNINSPAQLLQGKVPGLSIYNKGGDPNSDPVVRLRGISTVGANTEPLVVVDGVIGADLNNVDPNDIESINVLKDGSAAAIYGTRGSSGVILVTTKKGQASAGGPASENIRVDYNGYVSAATVANSLPVMTASEYINAGGNDLGSNTDWQDLVTRTGVSIVNNLAISGGNQTTTYRVSTNLRNIDGILENSGFDQINARANITHSALDDRLNLTLNVATTKRESNYSFNEALRYAALYNPTAPVRFDNGEYFQAVLFDNFNPKAIIDQNINDGESKNINYNAQASFDITDNLAINGNFGQQSNTLANGEFYPSTSFFRGLNRGGLARRYFEDYSFTLLETYGSYVNDFGSLGLNATVGYSFQEEQREGLTLELGNLPTNEGGYHIIDLSGDRVIGGTTNVVVDSYQTPEERIIAFFGRVNVTWDESIFFNASLRREGSTKLGIDNQWGLFPAAGVGADLLSFIELDPLNQLKVRVGYGVTGALPGPSGLSQAQYTYAFTGQGAVSPSNEPNPDLKWEEKAEINIGIDYGMFDDQLYGSLDLYSRTISDFILPVAIPAAESTTGATTQYQNVGELQTLGLEFSVNYDAVRTTEVLWNTGFVFSTYNTVLNDFIIDEQMRANLGSPGQNSTSMIRVAEGEEIGQIWGPVFDRVDTDGSPIMKDLNGDGQLIVGQGDALSDDGDFTKLGNGIPDFEIGWTNRVSYQNWDLNAFFRGAFGHSLVNTFRAFYEPIDPGAINSYNRIITEKAVDGLTVSQFSSLYVEKADFIKLDNLTLAYNFDTSDWNYFRSLRAYASVENVFTITNYSGLDPDVSFQDRGTVDNGGRLPANPDVLSPGIDRRNNYFTARTFTFGVSIGF